MSDGAFRDASAAVERAARLEEENAKLLDELQALRAQRDAGAFENREAVLRRLQEERADLAAQVEALTKQVADRDATIKRLEWEVGYKANSPAESLVRFLFRRRRPR
jgi:chromosome segregation ATPase